MDNSQQQSLLRLAAEGISVCFRIIDLIIGHYLNKDIQVYSPHTALDAAPGGIGDWLADIVTGTPVTASEDQKKQEKEADTEDENLAVEDPFVDKKRPVYLLQHHPSHRDVIKDVDLKL